MAALQLNQTKKVPAKHYQMFMRSVILATLLAASLMVAEQGKAIQRSLLLVDLDEEIFAKAAAAAQNVQPHVSIEAAQAHLLLGAETAARSAEPYVAAETEQYFMDHASELQLNFSQPGTMICPIWRNETGPKHIHEQLHGYLHELDDYNQRLDGFSATFPDLRQAIRYSGDAKSTLTKDDICQTVRLHPDGHDAIFKSRHLSTSPSGVIEPLLPPLRHPKVCFDKRKHLMDMKYLVHDFEAICQTIKPTSRTVLIDMGASLEFHHSAKQKLDSPALYLLNLFQTFGISFDHVYAFEVTPTTPARVFELVPQALLPAYHWINVGVSADPKHKLNPWQMLLDTYTEDDLVIVKLDIDTPSIEMPLTKQLLEDERLHKIVDHFYFEHHVTLGELLPNWRTSVSGTVKDSFDLFHGLRQKGIAAHSWV